MAPQQHWSLYWLGFSYPQSNHSKGLRGLWGWVRLFFSPVASISSYRQGAAEIAGWHQTTSPSQTLTFSIISSFFCSSPRPLKISHISPSWALFPRSLQWCSVTADYMHSSTVIRRVRVRVWERHRRHLAFYRSERLNKHQQLFPVLEWQERSPFIFGKRNVFCVSLKVSLKCPKLIQTESPSPLFRLDKKQHLEVILPLDAQRCVHKWMQEIIGGDRHHAGRRLLAQQWEYK